MRFTHPLTELLGTRAKVDILRVLARTEEPCSARRVARSANLSPGTATATLKELHQMGFLGMLRRGRAHCYWLDRNHVLVREVVLPAIGAEDTLRSRALSECLRPLRGYRAAVLFGSVGRGEEGWRSDIDLLLVVDDEPGRVSLERQLDEVAQAVLRSYGNALSPMVLTVAEFRSAVVRRQPFLQRILREGMVLAGELPGAEAVA